MKYLLSMDGGGSKTAWALTTLEGETVATYRCGGCSHPLIGFDGVLSLIRDGVQTLLRQANAEWEDLFGAALGIPCYGEYPAVDRELTSALTAMFPCPVKVVNDAELGMAGSLCLQEGIHMVAGTGAIAIGRDPLGRVARSNGWHSAFSDEGSGHWLGMQTLSLFCKQADGRQKRGALYELMMQHPALSAPEDVISYYDEVLSLDRKRTAALQELLYKAALLCDESAIALYRAAANELFLSIKALYQTLDFPADKPVKVSYSGGIFSVGELVLEPLANAVSTLPAILIPPALSPVMGGILLAMQTACPEKAPAFADTLKTLYSTEVLS